MKTLLSTFLLTLAALIGFGDAAAAQTVPQISANQIKPQDGFTRKSPCGLGTPAGTQIPDCGSNPPTYHITPNQCGTVFSTSQARNSDGTVSKKGVRYTLPSVAEFANPIYGGYTSDGGVAINTGQRIANRTGWCFISFVMGAPGAENYLRIAMPADGIQGIDKFTAFAQGAYDFARFPGEIVFPYLTPCTIRLAWNGTSWLLLSACGMVEEKLNQGQMAAAGQGRLFQVTQDPPWWTVGTMVGKLAFCPLNGQGLIANSNGGYQLSMLPINCAFRAALTGTATEWITYRNGVSGFTQAIAAGDAYAAGTAPNGETYAAGNYVVVTTAALPSFESGNTIEFHGIPTNLGTVIEGKWIGKKIDDTHIELHEKVADEGWPVSTFAVGPPSSFIAGDAIVTGFVNIPSMNYSMLQTSGVSTLRFTNPTNGAEFTNGGNKDALVGLARKVSGAYVDTANNRLVASWFNPVEKRCQSGLTAARTATSTTYLQINAEIQCLFVSLNRTGSNAAAFGDLGSPVRYTLIANVANNTAGAGCRLGVAFDSTSAPESDTTVLVTSATAGAKQMVMITGLKSGLSENNHYATALIQTVTNGTSSGTCTVDADARLMLDLRQ